MPEALEPVSVTKEIAEEEAPRKKEETGVSVRFSLFFDGTLNNRVNTSGRLVYERYQQAMQSGQKLVLTDEEKKQMVAYEEHGEEANSYANDHTNIAKMEGYIDQTTVGESLVLSVYIEGPGTTDLKGDKKIGYIAGMGASGVKQKVDSGINKLISRLEDKAVYGKLLETLDIDVFGFSRGAAAARFFIDKILHTTNHGKMKARPLTKRLRAAGFDIQEKAVSVNFVGLFDTVSSEGLNYGNDKFYLKLDSIKRPRVKQVIQLASADEHRSKFALTSIESAGSKGKQIFLPGVHSDIGGSYRDNTEEALFLNQSSSRAEIENDRSALIEAGWFTEGELEIERVESGVKGHRLHKIQYNLKSKRTNIKHDYDKIPLHLMVGYAKEHGVAILSDFDSEEEVADNLKPVLADLSAYAKQESTHTDWLSNGGKTFDLYPWLKWLRHEYLHFSAHLKAESGLVRPHKPRLVNGKRSREVHYG